MKAKEQVAKVRAATASAGPNDYIKDYTSEASFDLETKSIVRISHFGPLNTKPDHNRLRLSVFLMESKSIVGFDIDYLIQAEPVEVLTQLRDRIDGVINKINSDGPQLQLADWPSQR